MLESKEIYADLGLLATQFATIEQLVHDILVKIIVRNGHEIDDMFGITIVKDQTLGKRLGLLEELNHFHNDYSNPISGFIASVKPKIKIRNYFIHGVWTITEDSIMVENKKIKYKKLDNGRRWEYGGAKFVKPNELKKLNSELGEIILKATRILEDIENHGFEP
ncbi:hypothetical protein [Flagellimonas flava]|uniref:hypothetical protein n=1 Tax=Flagellimonas flava TaxID=570519 RepID=UPI003D6604B1